MKCKMTTIVNNETALKLSKRAARVGMTPREAFRYIIHYGVDSFLRLLVGATAQRRNFSFSV